MALSAIMSIGMAAYGVDAQAKLPSAVAEVTGKYVVRSGFEVDRLEFRKDGTVAMSVEHDHPGVTVSHGKWSFEGGTVHLSLPAKKGDVEHSSKSDCVFLVWGDRLILVDQEELKEGVIAELFRDDADRLNKLGKRDEEEMVHTKAFVRVSTWKAPLPFRYCKVLAPAAYAKQFKDIDLNLPRKSDRASTTIVSQPGQSLQTHD